MIEYVSAMLIGLVSAGHCLGMCGGLMLASGFATQSKRITVCYNAGRLTTYTSLGALLGIFAMALPSQTLPYLQYLSAGMLILTTLYLLNVSQLLSRFEAIGLPIWKRLQPLSKSLLPVRSARHGYLLGILWGFIPCGLVYSALAFSLASTHAWQSALKMLGFGIGTLPMMLSVGLLNRPLQPLLQHKITRATIAICCLCIAAYLIVITATEEHNHGHPNAHEHEHHAH